MKSSLSAVIDIHSLLSLRELTQMHDLLHHHTQKPKSFTISNSHHHCDTHARSNLTISMVMLSVPMPLLVAMSLAMQRWMT